MGMQTIVSEGGGGISGGQRQRILIARAVCGKPKILMLDEATSALDNVTQRHVSDALEGLNCTRIVIAHRLSTIRHADRIIMLDDGRIVEEGSYEELVARGGAFADLVRRQRLEDEI
jgi:ABC-type bacteriocin/lantibiotic exporter with double-glycine peptidase domain